MQDFLRHLNRAIYIEFPEADFKAELIVGETVGKYKDMHAMIILNFTINKERIRYRYVRVAESPSSNYTNSPFAYSEILDSLKQALMNSIIFGTGWNSIYDLVSGRAEPLDVLIEK